MLFIFILYLMLVCHANAKCGYEICPETKAGMFNVHIIAHSHDDVGWLKTVDQYYYGTEEHIQKANVRSILNTVVDSLLENPNRRFIYVESAFLWRWWKEQGEARRSDVRNLVNEGRLQFVGGGWTMNDEATVHYTALIDNMAFGLRFLNDTFGTCGLPLAAWQVDPFGHSREQANLFAQMGFDGFYIGRLDYMERQQRSITKTMDFLWKGSDSLDSSWIFSTVLVNLYQPPEGFRWGHTCKNDPIISDPKSPKYNVKHKVDQFLNVIRAWSRFYTSSNVMITLGDDFAYQEADMCFRNMDTLIKYTNDRKEKMNGKTVNVFYSNPACYTKALYDANLNLTTKMNDFFPYGSDQMSYWTGYYTSRPALKRYERESDVFLQACKQISAFSHISENTLSEVNDLRDAMGILQHHDAVTGTQRQAVQDDYAQRLSIGRKSCENVIVHSNHIADYSNLHHSKISFCPLLNVSRCEVLETYNKVMVTYYNPQARYTTAYVRIPVPSEGYIVLDSNGKHITPDIIPLPTEVVSQGTIESSSNSGPTTELVFITMLPPLGYRSFYVNNKRATMNRNIKVKTFSATGLHTTQPDIVVNNGVLTVTIDGQTGNVKKIQRGMAKYYLWQDFYYYKASNSRDGAYLFRPTTEKPFLITDALHSFSYYKGNSVTEIHHKINNWTSHITRLYDGANFLEVEWMIGPIPITDGIGKEIVVRYLTDLVTKKKFFTDVNGRQHMLRQRNYLPIAANYYPLTSRMSIQEEHGNKRKVEVIVDRAQGGTSLNDGEMEVMLHRRLLHDDTCGVNQALNETAFGKGLVVRGKHRLFFANTDDEDYYSGGRILAMNSFYEPIKMFIPRNINSGDYNAHNIFKESYLGLSPQQFPENVNLLTFERLDKSTLLFRLEHPFDENEDPNKLSAPVEFKLSSLLQGMDVKSIRETTLGGNQWLDETQRLQWTNDNKIWNTQQDSVSDDSTILLNPSEIRTFIATVNVK